MNINRRSLIRGVTASVFGLPVVAGAAEKSRHWDETFDVVVVGYGGAGACAAIAADDAGAKVCIVV